MRWRISYRHVRRAKIIEKMRALLTMTVENGYTQGDAMTIAAMATKLMLLRAFDAIPE